VTLVWRERGLVGAAAAVALALGVAWAWPAPAFVQQPVAQMTALDHPRVPPAATHSRSAPAVARPQVLPVVTPHLRLVAKASAPPAPTRPPRPMPAAKMVLGSQPAPAALTPQQTGQAALALLTERAPYLMSRLFAAGWTIRYLPSSARPGYRGLTDGGVIYLFIRPDQGVSRTERYLAHEVGHAINCAWGNDSREQAYLTLRGIAGAPSGWMTPTGPGAFASPAEDWAEVVARWLTGNADFASTVAPAPSDAQMAELIPLFQPGPASQPGPVGELVNTTRLSTTTAAGGAATR
jgi:hypothetical protein